MKEVPDEQSKNYRIHPTLAGAIAGMWNKSSSGWNGATMARTPEMVISEHSSVYHTTIALF